LPESFAKVLYTHPGGESLGTAAKALLPKLTAVFKNPRRNYLSPDMHLCVGA
jgi:hypothetical protein